MKKPPKKLKVNAKPIRSSILPEELAAAALLYKDRQPDRFEADVLSLECWNLFPLAQREFRALGGDISKHAAIVTCVVADKHLAAADPNAETNVEATVKVVAEHVRALLSLFLTVIVPTLALESLSSDLPSVWKKFAKVAARGRGKGGRPPSNEETEWDFLVEREKLRQSGDTTGLTEKARDAAAKKQGRRFDRGPDALKKAVERSQAKRRKSRTTK